MSEFPTLKDLEERIEKRIKEVRDDFAQHCKASDERMRSLEDSSIKSEVLLEQFVDMQTRQTLTNEKLNVTLAKVDASMSRMEESLGKLFTKTDKAGKDIAHLQSETAVLPEIQRKIEENEKKHHIDLRDIDQEYEKENVKKNWKKPVAITAGVGGGVTLIALLYKAIELGMQILEKLPAQ